MALARNVSGTDHGPFLATGVPALGIGASALQDHRVKFTLNHTPQDTLDVVSAGSLERTGRYIERYITSLELPENASLLKGFQVTGSAYLEHGYVSPVYHYLGLLAFLMAALLVVAADLANAGLTAWRTTTGGLGWRAAFAIGSTALMFLVFLALRGTTPGNTADCPPGPPISR